MIVKNEERSLARAVKSVQRLISELIIVDTGSTDGTLDVARDLGANVYCVPWKNDFSLSRNVSLQHATCDWILVLDADEGIAERDHQEISKLTRNPTGCFEFIQRHYSTDERLSDFCPVTGEYPEWEDGQGGYFESSCVRMFPNHEGIHFRGKVHELVEHSIRDLGKHKIVKTCLRIHHYGHTAEVKGRKQKAVVYTALGQAKAAEGPRDWKNFFELGVEHNNNGRLVESAEALKKAAELNPSFAPTWVNLGYVLCELRAYKEAEKALQTAIRVAPQEEEAYCNLAVVYMRTGRAPIAEKFLRRALALNQNYVNAYCNLGGCLALQGRISESANIFHRALELFPACSKAESELGALYLSQGLYENAELHLKRALTLRNEDPRLYLHLGQLYRSIKRSREAAEYLRSFLRLQEEKGALSAEMEEFLGKVRKECELLLHEEG